MSKHGNPKTTTDKVCNFFIEAVENGKYGWFWQCPKGGDKCMYKHSLPPGYARSTFSLLTIKLLITPYPSFILKTKEQRAAEKALMDKSPLKTLTLEDFLESERHKLTGTLTPVTPETFAKWKKERLNKKAAEDEARRAKEATGRAMFEQGDWDESSADESSEDEGNDDERNDNDGWGDLEALRMETERLRMEREEARVGGRGTTDTDNHVGDGDGDDDDGGTSNDINGTS